MNGVLTLARQLGELVDAKPVDQPQMIAGPTRPSRGRWPADVWAEMQAIYAAPDPTERPVSTEVRELVL